MVAANVDVAFIVQSLNENFKTGKLSLNLYNYNIKLLKTDFLIFEKTTETKNY